MTQKQTAARCSVEESIGQYIALLLITRYGEYRFDESLGCKIWEYDFENAPFVNSRQAELEKAISDTIAQHEPRLDKPKARMTIEGLKSKDKFSKRIRLVIAVEGILLATNERFLKSDYTIFFSPISTV